MAEIRDTYERNAIDIASGQGQILVCAQLYNAAHQLGHLSREMQWADMDWIIDRQGSEWVFVGAKPKQGYQFLQELNVARGFPVHKKLRKTTRLVRAAKNL
jgi:hypothetical protein